MKKIRATITLIILLGMLLLPAVAVADTGTYEISKQYVTLDVRLDGNVLIEYNITMKVTGGNIPWVTVGLPNSKYTIKDYGGVAKTCKRDDYGSWTGVKMTLDKTYYAGDSFYFSFSALQKGFIYEYGDNQSSIQFTPCWWDNAVTKDLKVKFTLPNEIKEVMTTLEGATFGESYVQWQWSNVPKGQKHTVGFIMDGAPFTSLATSTGSSGDFTVWFFIFISVIIIIGVLGVTFFASHQSSSSTRSHYTSPSISASSYVKKTRHINMTCPNDATKLSKRTISNTTIDFCDTCGGCYFDKGEIESLIKKDITESQFNTNNIKMFTGRKCEVLSKCPRCDGKVEKKEKTIGIKTYRIFVCDDCDGIWLEHETYDALKEARGKQIGEAKTKLASAGTTKTKDDYYDDDWWLFYPYIVFCPRTYRYRAPPSRTARTSSRSSYTSSCACVSCACVASCACACACASSGAAGCAPKNRVDGKLIYNQIKFGKKDDK